MATINTLLGRFSSYTNMVIERRIVLSELSNETLIELAKCDDVESFSRVLTDATSISTAMEFIYPMNIYSMMYKEIDDIDSTEYELILKQLDFELSIHSIKADIMELIED